MKAQLGELTIIGTAHVSPTSVAEVRETIQEVRPAAVCVELDEARRQALEDPTAWANVPLTKLIKEGRSAALLAQIFLGSYQRAIGEEYGVRPGEEMLAAIEEAEALGAEVHLSDRDVGITLRRAMRTMGFREKMRVAWEMVKAATGASDDDMDVDDLLEEDALSAAMAELASIAPTASSVLIDERDAYLAQRIREARDATDGPVVAVVGAGHLAGIREHLESDRAVDTAELDGLPDKGFSWGKAFAWTFAAAILGLFGFLIYQATQTGDWQALAEAGLYYLVASGIPAALGALIAGGHVLTIIVAFLASPFTSLNPLVAAGWFAGAVEAWRHEPTVGDFEGLSKITTFRDMRKNRIVRILLVAALVNIGSMVGSAFGGAELLRRALGS